jgi:hypothetical protein
MRWLSNWICGLHGAGVAVLILLSLAGCGMTGEGSSGPFTSAKLSADYCGPNAKTVGRSFAEGGTITNPGPEGWTNTYMAVRATTHFVASEVTDSQSREPIRLNGDGLADLGPLAAGEHIKVVVTVTPTVPGNAGFGLIYWGSDQSESNPPAGARVWECGYAVVPREAP